MNGALVKVANTESGTMKSQCTCGGKLAIELAIVGDKTGRTHGCDPMQCSSLTNQRDGEGNSSGASFPFEASFVEIPSSYPVTTSPSERGFRSQGALSRQTMNSTSCERNGALEKHCTSAFLRSAEYLHQATLNPHDPPPLCLFCLQR
jgi:hypothetical protein